MGKIKIKTLGMEELEEKEKLAAKRKREQKQLRKAAVEPDREGIDTKDQIQQPNPKQVEAPQAEIKEEKKTKKIVIKKKIHGKKYLAAKKSINQSKKYSLKEAIALMQSFEKRKFDESVELHLSLLETGIKGDITLPHGTGKSLNVVVVDDALIQKLDKGIIDFDVLIATPTFMPKLVKFAKLLGPKGLMPNPKQGTVTADTAAALKKFSKGLSYFKTEAKFPLMHLTVGKRSFTNDQLIDNIKALVLALGKQKIRSMHLTATMTPSVSVDVESL